MRTSKAHITKWLESALNEAGGISNLRMAIECYTDVVKRLTGQKDNTMDLQAFFNKKGNERFLDIALEIEKTSVYFEGYLENYNTEQTKKTYPKT
ncbi:hypothetical protein [Helicobacter rappini]|uniref:hypothetical protein n=1 Tax=Helicobacter rappini TaxID=95150 RepID=UPI000CF0A1DF|nr:hypothetical protein [Helicobacter rappini]